jgi:hypothetical protein
MVDETKPSQGEEGGLPPSVQEKLENPEWRAEARRLEGLAQDAVKALLVHTGAAALSTPFEVDGKLMALVAGDPRTVWVALDGQGPELLEGRHLMVEGQGSPNSVHPLLALLQQMMAARGDEECDCEKCVAERAKPH